MTAWRGIAAGLATAAVWAAPALACPVCYGEAEGGVIDGTRLSIAFLGGLVYLVLFGGVGMVLVARRRALRANDPRHGLHLVEGAAGGGVGAVPGDDPLDTVDDHDDRREPGEETSER